MIASTSRRRHDRRRRLIRRRIQAVLAGGVVLGVGASATLASWNDSEYATATFTSGRFGIEGSLDGASFGKHNPTVNPNPTSAATLSFTPVFAAMYPGAVSYAPFVVRTTAGSLAGRVQLVAGTPTGLLTDLRYGVRLTSSVTNCKDGTGYATGTVVVADNSTLTTGGGLLGIQGNSSSPQVYCFAVVLPLTAGNAMQNQTLAQTWQFSATTP